jgi:hypothetical protein
MGCMYPDLDEYLTTDERRNAVLRIIESVIGRKDLTLGARRTLEMIASLVGGKIKTDASSPLDYMVQGDFERMRK